MKLKKFVVVFGSILLLTLASGLARANDNIVSTVTIPAGQPTPIIINNGVPSGTIQLWYTVVGTNYPCGAFAQFNLNLADLAGKSGQSPTYPVGLNLVQSGAGTPVQFSPDPSGFSVSGTSWTDNSTVAVSINCANIPEGAQDIVGNLNEQTVPSGAHLDTISTIQVHIRLLNSTSACLFVYSFETTQDTGLDLTSVVVNVKNSTGVVQSSNPGEISVDGLVANTCAASLSFDLAIGLDSNWESNSTGNPVQTYTTAGELDPANFSPITNLISTGGSPAGTQLCLQNVTLANGNSFLATVRSDIKTTILASSLPTDGDFDFLATLYQAGSACGTAYPTPSITNSPGTSTLSFTTK